MATADNIRSYVSAADMVDYWINNVAPRYFNMDNANTYRAGTLGLIMDIMGTTTEDTANAMMIARREFYPNTAQYMKSLYRHAAGRFMDAPMAIPATANILLMIQQSDILKYGETTGDLHTFVLDDTFIAYVDDIPFMLDYPITILSTPKENGKYAHTTHYDFYIDNTLSKSTERYLPNKVMNYKGTEYVIIAAQMRQIYKTYDSQLVTSNSVVNTVTMDFVYDGDLANFEVFYKEDDSKARVQLEKRMQDSGISKNPFCWYTLVDEDTIRLTFPANAYFMPKLNSTISIEIATTLGSKGNFDTYESDIVSENASVRYPYNAQVPVFGTVDGPSTGGTDLISKEEFRTETMRAYSTNHTYISVNDIQLYFDKLMIGTNDRFKFTPKRDDAFIRLYGAFLLMKDNGDNVIPTNTLDIELDPLQDVQDFDLYSEAVHRFIIKPGALFTYKKNEEDKYVLTRIHDKKLSDNMSDYDNDDGFWVCPTCGYKYDGTENFRNVLKGKPCDICDTDHHAGEFVEYFCPHCGTAANDFVNERFIFTNPYLISVSIDNFMAGYFLNSTSKHHNLSYTAVNDQSIVQFIAKHFKLERNAINGENFYRFSVAISPSVEVNQETIYKKNDGIVAAKHNGFVKAIEHNGTAVYATIEYTDDPTLADGVPEDSKFETIQVSSYITKVDETFRVCPKCGRRISRDEYANLYTTGFVDEEGNPLLCPNCVDGGEDGKAMVESYEEKYIDFDYIPGYDMKFAVGDAITKNDVIATAKPTDLGRIRLMMDLGGVMDSAVRRYIPLTLEEAHDETTDYYIFAAYISTDDMIDSKHIMSISDGYVMTDGSSGHTRSISIPIEGLSMKLHAFYQYRDDDELDAETRNPRHQYAGFAYVEGYTFTNTYELHENDSITLIKALDNAKGFLDAVERPQPEPEPEPEPEPDPNHPGAEHYEIPVDYENSVYLRTYDHNRFLVDDPTNDRVIGNYLTVDKEPTGVVPTPPPEEEKPDVEIDPSWPPKDGIYGENFMFRLRNCPMVAANWIKVEENEDIFIERISNHYDEIEKVIWDLENAFAIDMKFYNSYGKSKFYKIGNNSNLEVLDSVNITISFGVAVNFPASADVFRTNFRTFVQQYIEATDEMVGNGIDIYIMNLIAEAKAKFDEIGYLEYYGINRYDYFAQRLVIMSDEEILRTVKADSFVPEFLNIIRETTSSGTRPKVNITVLESLK